MPLELIKHQKVYVQAMNQIRNSIIKGEYKVGSKLPTEKELTKIFQISRPSVREALSGLTALGLIEAKAGGGCYIKSINPSSAIELIFDNESNPLEILEVRKIIEPGIARLASERRQKPDLEAMEKLIERARTMASDGPSSLIDEILNLDREIHLSFARATHNNVMLAILERIFWYMKQGSWNDLQKLLKKEPGLTSKYMGEHESIYKAIREKKPSKAFQQLRNHLQGITEDLLKEGRGEF